MCEYMMNFILKLKDLPDRYSMNTVLENFTILQVSRDVCWKWRFLLNAYEMHRSYPTRTLAKLFFVWLSCSRCQTRTTEVGTVPIFTGSLRINETLSAFDETCGAPALPCSAFQFDLPVFITISFALLNCLLRSVICLKKFYSFSLTDLFVGRYWWHAPCQAFFVSWQFVELFAARWQYKMLFNQAP